MTYADGIVLFLNGDEVEVTHVARAHTDGDSIVRFRKANVVHMGDTFFNGNYPFIDLDSGGSIDGVIAAVDKVLADHRRQHQAHPRPRRRWGPRPTSRSTARWWPGSATG